MSHYSQAPRSPPNIPNDMPRAEELNQVIVEPAWQMYGACTSRKIDDLRSAQLEAARSFGRGNFAACPSNLRGRVRHRRRIGLDSLWVVARRQIFRLSPAKLGIEPKAARIGVSSAPKNTPKYEPIVSPTVLVRKVETCRRARFSLTTPTRTHSSRRPCFCSCCCVLGIEHNPHCRCKATGQKNIINSFLKKQR